MQYALAPLLTEADPAEQTLEGALDPLGLYAIADSLALRLAPGVRERMSHPRFLTAMAVGMSVCEHFGPERFAADNVSSSWQVFEWYIVEALVRTYGDGDEIRGLPGRNKASAALRNRLPLSAGNYLKSPSVFGFFGVYKLLGETIGFFDEDGLLPEGWALVEAWESDQQLRGFHLGSGAGGRERRRLISAVSDGLDRGATSRSAAWNGWTFLAQFLAPYDAGKHESDTLWSAIIGEPGGLRAELAEFLVSRAGRDAWMSSVGSERHFHAALKQGASGAMKSLLDTIGVYERFSRCLQDAFDEILWRLTEASRSLSPKSLAQGRRVKWAAKAVPEMRDRLSTRLEQYGETSRLEEWFDDLFFAASTEEWVERLLQHHLDNQSRKPPNGKNSWLVSYDDGSVSVRSAYAHPERVLRSKEYVHHYRSRPLVSFASDLGKI